MPKLTKDHGPSSIAINTRNRNAGFVVRFIAPRAYQQVDWAKWNAMVKSPGAAARGWAVEVTNGMCKSHMGDSFKFELQNNRDLRGFFRIHDHDTALNLLRASGMKDSESGQRWFVEPVAGELKGLPNSVLWVDYQDDERWDQYASRVRRMCQEAGVIHGRFQLGIRVYENDSRRQVRPCTWQIDQVPKSWTFDEVEELLTALAFTEIEVVAKNGDVTAHHGWSKPNTLVQRLCCSQSSPSLAAPTLSCASQRRRRDPRFKLDQPNSSQKLASISRICQCRPTRLSALLLQKKKRLMMNSLLMNKWKLKT